MENAKKTPKVFEELSREARTELVNEPHEKYRGLIYLTDLPPKPLIWAMRLIREAMQEYLNPNFYDAFIHLLVYEHCFEIEDFFSAKTFYEDICSKITDDQGFLADMDRVIELERFSRAHSCTPFEGVLLKRGVSASELSNESEVKL